MDNMLTMHLLLLKSFKEGVFRDWCWSIWLNSA